MMSKSHKAVRRMLRLLFPNLPKKEWSFVGNIGAHGSRTSMAWVNYEDSTKSLYLIDEDRGAACWDLSVCTPTIEPKCIAFEVGDYDGN